MIKLFVTLSICLVIASTGCQTLMQNESPIARENHDIINMKNRSEGFNVINPDKNYHQIQRFGFVRHQRETALPQGGSNPNIAAYDPELLADAISKLAILVPDVHDVATLVTDKQVLVAYKTNSDDNFETADQVKRTAMSVVPRFFHVYVSDDPKMLTSIERFGSLSSTTKGVQDVLKHTIEEMLLSPQGRRISASENENGETDTNIDSMFRR
jgi:hypothetical protein